MRYRIGIDLDGKAFVRSTLTQADTYQGARRTVEVTMVPPAVPVRDLLRMAEIVELFPPYRIRFGQLAKASGYFKWENTNEQPDQESRD